MMLTFLPFLFFAFQSRAAIFEGPVSTALGGAGAAGVQILESSHTNPATLPHLNGYHMGFMYGSRTQQLEKGAPGVSVSDLGIVLTDATEESVIPASLSYTKGNYYLGGKEFSETEIHLGMGYRPLQLMSFGVALERISKTQMQGPEFVDHNVTTGILITPMKNVGIAAVFHDMLDTKEIPMIPTTTLGFFWMYQDIARVYLDWSQPQKTNPNRKDILSLGLESLLMGNGISFRTGGKWNQVESKRFASAGLGWDGPNLSLDYAYEKDLDADQFRHLVDMRVQF